MSSVPGLDRLLSEVGETLRDEDERVLVLLEKLAAQTATAAEHAELVRLAAESAEIRVMMEQCSPAAVAEDVDRALQSAVITKPSVVPLPQTTPLSKSAPVIELRRPWLGTRTWGWTVGFGLSAAAAVLVWVLLPADPLVQSYSLEVGTTAGNIRGASLEPSRVHSFVFAENERLTLTLRPDTAHPEPMMGAVFRAGSPGLHSAPVKVADLSLKGDRGVMAVTIEASALPEPMSTTLLVVIAPQTDWSDALASQMAKTESPEPPWQKWVIVATRKSGGSSSQ